jgi:hypothetical protein
MAFFATWSTTWLCVAIWLRATWLTVATWSKTRVHSQPHVSGQVATVSFGHVDENPRCHYAKWLLATLSTCRDVAQWRRGQRGHVAKSAFRNTLICHNVATSPLTRG